MAREFIVCKRLSKRCEDRLRIGEQVKIVKSGNDPAHSGWPGNEQSPNNKLILTADGRWYGWMMLGEDLELKEMQSGS